jgi:hypothetical protein
MRWKQPALVIAALAVVALATTHGDAVLFRTTAPAAAKGPLLGPLTSPPQPRMAGSLWGRLQHAPAFQKDANPNESWVSPAQAVSAGPRTRQLSSCSAAPQLTQFHSRHANGSFSRVIGERLTMTGLECATAKDEAPCAMQSSEKNGIFGVETKWRALAAACPVQYPDNHGNCPPGTHKDIHVTRDKWGVDGGGKAGGPFFDVHGDGAYSHEEEHSVPECPQDNPDKCPADKASGSQKGTPGTSEKGGGNGGGGGGFGRVEHGPGGFSPEK